VDISSAWYCPDRTGGLAAAAPPSSSSTGFHHQPPDISISLSLTHTHTHARAVCAMECKLRQKRAQTLNRRSTTAVNGASKAHVVDLFVARGGLITTGYIYIGRRVADDMQMNSSSGAEIVYTASYEAKERTCARRAAGKKRWGSDWTQSPALPDEKRLPLCLSSIGRSRLNPGLPIRL
jgi:hypothetical protein